MASGLNEAQVVANEMERVRPKVPVLFDWDDVFYAQVEKRDAEKVSARSMRVPLELRPGGKFGAFDPDGGDLGRGDGPTFDKALVDVVHMKHAVSWTKKAEWATDDGRKAVLNTFRHLLAKSMAEFRRQCDSQCMTAGDGVLGTTSTIPTNDGTFTTLTFAGTTDGYNNRLLRFGQNINIYNSALSAIRKLAAPITFYDLANKTIKITEPTLYTLAASGDKVVVEGVTAIPPTWLLGVPYHHSNASTGTWLGLSRVTNPEIRATRVNAAGALALPFPRLAMNKIGDRVGIDNQYKCEAWMHPCQKQAYEELGFLVSMINKTSKDEGLDLYFGDNMQMAGAPVKTSFSWDKTRIDFIVKELWGRAEMHPAGFYEVEGRKIFEDRGASGGVATSQTFYITVSWQLYNENPAACAYIDGLTIPSGY